MSNVEMDERERQTLKNVNALIDLARANFPRTADVRIETCGCDPKASLTMPAYVLARLLRETEEAK